jgi:hypothetical protein
MTFSLYAATVPTKLQILQSIVGLIDKAEDHCADQGFPPATLIDARIAEDMFPFAFQIKSVAGHSLGAIEGALKGIFSPDITPAPASFAGLRAMLIAAIEGLSAINPETVNGLVGKDMRFSFRDHHMDFLAEDFLLSFSQPNFYFHATTAYDILRMQGLPIGKRDFSGQMRMRVTG